MGREICEELKQNFVDFSYEANSQRAFPSALDGLKPGQRACLWEFYNKGYNFTKPHVKSAKVAGGVIGSWWPHGKNR
jgi:DNA gyrase/topoisomerase IV subunit A